jgi:hypothetical protein
MVLAAWRWSTGKRRLDVRQCACERIGLSMGEIRQKRRKALAQQLLRRGERLSPAGRERNGHPPAVFRKLAALEQPGVNEAREKLRHGWA